MPVYDERILLDDLMYAEGPRWHDDLLYVSDFTALEVVRIALDGSAYEKVVTVEGQPSGTGWTPGGDLLVVSQLDSRLLRFDGRSLTVVADVSATSPATNDMVVDRHGRGYMGGMPSASLKRHTGPASEFYENLYLVTPGDSAAESHCRIVASELEYPNGTVITDDGKTLIVAETAGKRLTAFDILPDGGLSARRTWADLGEMPDGICLDAEGCVWVAVPISDSFQGFIRVAEGGEVRDRVPSDRSAMAVTLGGPEGLHLFMVESSVIGRGDMPELRVRGNSRVRVAVTDVPAAGLP
jgi:sugar lactone lactonase YvrE